jgi:hypothetical protein
MMGDGPFAVRGRCECHGGIGKRENEPAMAQAMTVYHFGPHQHRQPRPAGSDVVTYHAKASTGRVVVPHGVGTTLCQSISVGHPLNTGTRFS